MLWQLGPASPTPLFEQLASSLCGIARDLVDEARRLGVHLLVSLVTAEATV